MLRRKSAKQKGENTAEFVTAEINNNKKNTSKTRRLFARKERRKEHPAEERNDGLFGSLFHTTNNETNQEERDNGSKSSSASRASLVSKIFSGKSHASASLSRTERTQANIVYDSFGDASVLRVVEEECELVDPMPNHVWIKVQVSSSIPYEPCSFFIDDALTHNCRPLR